ncbi:MAG: hypothetical protein JF605_10525 [Burkholderia sp.]|nr:hypothetical protein [Burkholderia sp.]
MDYQVRIRAVKGGSDGKMATNSPDYEAQKETPAQGGRGCNERSFTPVRSCCWLYG